MKKVMFCLVIALITVVLFNVPTNKAMSATPKRGGTLTFALHYEPQHWDPHLTLSYRTQVYGSMIWSKLLMDKQGPGVDQYTFDVAPDLAESWEWKSSTEVIFHLRKGVKFQNKAPVNGRELTSADVKYTIDRIFDPKVKSANKGYYDSIKTIETPDKYTVRFLLKQPFAPFMKYLALTYGMIVPKEAVEVNGDLKNWKTAIGSGPFELKEYKSNEVAHFVAHKNYYKKGLPYVDAVKIRIMPSREVIVAAFRTKQLDQTGYMEFEDIQAMLKKHPKLQVNEYWSNSWPKITFATDKVPFKDKRVRQAMSMSIDRQKMLDILWDGRGSVDNVIARAQWGSIPVAKLGNASKYFRRNIEAAKKLLKAAGFKAPLKVKMVYTTAYGSTWVSLTEALIGQINSSGVFKVQSVTKEYGAYITGPYRGKYEEDMVWGYTTPPGDPDEVLFDAYHSSSLGNRNAARVNNPKLDALIEAQRRELDKEKRLALLKEIQLYLAEEMYTMPTVTPPLYTVTYPHVKDYNYHIVPAYNIGDRYSIVWIDR